MSYNPVRRLLEVLRPAAAMAVLVVLCAACSGQEAREEAPSDDQAIAQETATSRNEPASATEEATTEANRLTLARDGVGPAMLGSSIESTLGTLRERWGPPEIRELKCESFATSKIVIWDGVMLVFNSGGLAGYLVGPKPGSVVTPIGRDLEHASTSEGLELGDSVEAARHIYGDAFHLDETTLGPEWYVSTSDGSLHMRGFADGLGSRDTITRIGLGDICAVR